MTGGLAKWLCGRKGISPEDAEPISHAAFKERQYDLLAEQLRKALDLQAIHQILEAEE